MHSNQTIMPLRDPMLNPYNWPQTYDTHSPPVDLLVQTRAEWHIRTQELNKQLCKGYDPDVAKERWAERYEAIYKFPDVLGHSVLSSPVPNRPRWLAFWKQCEEKCFSVKDVSNLTLDE